LVQPTSNVEPTLRNGNFPPNRQECRVTRIAAPLGFVRKSLSCGRW
jgi:hypothetical protein